MASCSTSTLQSGNTLPKLPSNLQPFESMNYFSAANLDKEYNDCVSTDLKSFAAKDQKLHDWVTIREAKNRTETVMRTFLNKKAEKIKKEAEDEETDEGSDGSDSEDDDDEVQVMIPLAVFGNRAFLEDKAALTKIEVRSFFFKIWLRRIQLTRERNQDIYKRLLDFEHAIHNAQESIKEFKELFYSQRYKREELEDILRPYENRLEEASTKALKEKEKASFEMLEEDVAIFLSNKARLCALLGLQLDYLDCLDEMPPEDRDHLTLCEWIATFLANDYESVHSTDNIAMLAEIGFDPLSSAVETIMARAGSIQQHIETCEMAELFIKDEFRYNPLLCPLVDRFPFQSTLTNTWFQLPRPEKGKESNLDLCHINILNIVANQSAISTLIQTNLSDLLPEDDQNVVLLHGTDHKSARDILLRGIDLRKGRQKRDFSCGSGFYLTPRNKLDDALNWAKNTTRKPALLIFQVNRREHSDDARKLNLHGNEERWRGIVSSFRSGERTATTRQSLNGYDLIEGPSATITRNESGELIIEQKPSSDQMCLNSDDYARKFRQTLHSVIFVDVS